MAQTKRALESCIGPCACDREPAINTYLTVILIVNHQCLCRERFCGLRHFEFLPLNANLLLEPPLHRRTNAFRNTDRAGEKTRIANER